MRFSSRLLLLACAVLAAGCADAEAPVALSTQATSVATSSTVAASTTQTTTAAVTDEPEATVLAATSSTSSPTSAREEMPAPEEEQPILIRIRLDRRVADDATDGFEALTQAVLADERGWGRAGFEFSFSETDYDYTIVLAEGGEVDQLCLPYDTGGRFSCQIGALVALNADRWRTAVESWPASLDEYRTMLVNHEVGHLVGQHHPAVRCAGDGLPSPVMAQQSSGVAPCSANPWPLPWEILCAEQRVEPLAPPYEQDIDLTCGPDGPVG